MTAQTAIIDATPVRLKKTDTVSLDMDAMSMKNQGMKKTPQAYVRVLMVAFATVGILVIFASLGTGLGSPPPAYDLHPTSPKVTVKLAAVNHVNAQVNIPPCQRIYLPLILYPETLQPDLSASYKIAFPGVVGYFDEITYTLVVRNNGRGPARVTLSDIPPLPYRENSATGGLWWDEETQTLRWEGTINAADARTFQYVVHGPIPIIPHDTQYWNELVIDDGVHPPFTRSAVVLANPWPTPASVHTPTGTSAPIVISTTILSQSFEADCCQTNLQLVVDDATDCIAEGSLKKFERSYRHL